MGKDKSLKAELAAEKKLKYNRPDDKSSTDLNGSAKVDQNERTVVDRGVKKQAKDCLYCKKEFTWRKKWADNWDDVKYCSNACKESAKASRDATKSSQDSAERPKENGSKNKSSKLKKQIDDVSDFKSVESVDDHHLDDAVVDKLQKGVSPNAKENDIKEQKASQLVKQASNTASKAGDSDGAQSDDPLMSQQNSLPPLDLLRVQTQAPEKKSDDSLREMNKKKRARKSVTFCERVTAHPCPTDDEDDQEQVQEESLRHTIRGAEE